MLRYFISLIICFAIGIETFGRNIIPEQKDIQKDSSSNSKNLIRPSLRLGLDVSRLFLSAIRSDFNGGEVSLDYNPNKYLYEVHLGYARHSDRLENYKPVSEGFYGSIGFSKNIFQESDNILGFGARLAGSSWNFQPQNVKIKDGFQNQEIMLDLEESKCQALWAEVVATMRAKVVGSLMMGFEIRVKGLLHSKAGNYQPYAIPGYGLYNNKISLGFNYFIFFNLPTQKLKVVSPSH
jgi:hypothetical protein